MWDRVKGTMACRGSIGMRAPAGNRCRTWVGGFIALGLLGGVFVDRAIADEAAEREKLAKLVEAIGGDEAGAKPAVAGAEAIRLPAAEIVQAMLPLGLRAEPQRINDEAVAVIVNLKAAAVPELATALKSGSVERRLVAMLALGRIGVPSRKASAELVPLLKDASPLVRMNAAECLQQIHARTALKALRERIDAEEEPRILFTLVKALVALGGPTGDIVPLLKEWTTSDDPLRKLIAAKTLGELGPEAAPAVQPLIAFLESADVESGRMAAESLARIGLAAKPAGPALRKAIDDEKYAPHRADLAEFLWRVSRDPLAPATVKKVLDAEPSVGHAMLLWKMNRSPEAIEAARSLLKSEKPAVRMDALRFVSRIGPPASAAASEVMALLKDDDPDVRLWAAMAVGRLERAGRPAAELLKEMTRRGDATSRVLAAWSLWLTAGDASAVAAALSDEKADVRRFMAERLGASRIEAKSMGPALRTGLNDKEPIVRIRCAEAIWLADRDHAVYPVISELLKHPSSEARQAAALAIGYTFPASDATFVDDLIVLLADSSLDARATACEALGRIGAPAAKAVPRLIANVTDADEDDAIVSASAEALGLIGDVRPEVVETLRRSLKHLNPYVRVHAALALQNLAQDDAIAPVLEEGLKSRDCRARIVAAEALGKRNDERAAPALLEALIDSKFAERELASNERFMAVRALSRLGAKAKAAIPALREMRHDEDPILRNFVEAALVQIEAARP